MPNHGKPLVIGVCGPSASGKTLWVDNLMTRLADESISVLREDSYYFDQSMISMEERNNLNYDHPDSIEHDLMVEHISDLQQYKSVDVPTYNFHKHERYDSTTLVKPSKTIIIDGILILTQPKIRELIDISIFIDTPLDICLLRRLQRDQAERSRPIDLILHQYQRDVRPMYWKYIEPSRKLADLIVTGGGNNWTAIDVIQSRIEQGIKG